MIILSVFCIALGVLFVVLIVWLSTSLLNFESKRKELENLQAWFKQNDANHVAKCRELEDDHLKAITRLSQSQATIDENAKELESLRFANDELSKSINEFAQTNGQLNAEIVSLQIAMNTANKAYTELEAKAAQPAKQSIFATPKKRGKQV